MRILHIDSEKTWRGGQQQAAYLVKGLLDKGLATAIVCQPESGLHKHCSHEKLPCFPMRMRGELDFFSALKIARICRKNNYTILHLHSAHALAIGLWVKLFLPSVKLVGVRRVAVPIKKNPLSRFKYKTPKVEKHICISENIKKVMVEDGIHESRLATIHSGVDINRFSVASVPLDFRENLKIPAGHLVVGTVAALSREKDYPSLLHAAKRIIEKRDDVTFVAAGSGPDEKDILRLKNELGLGGRFIFAGYRKDIGNFLKTFDIFVLASYREGLGTSILDAQSCGLPVIGCRVGGVPEIITHGHDGILVPPRSPEALSHAVLMLLNDDKKRHRLGQNARESVEKFSIKATIDKNIDLYHELLGS